MMNRFITKEIKGYKYGVADNILVDTVPAAFAEEWLSSAPGADTLILANADPFPDSVRLFVERHPDGKVIAPYYTGFMLEKILGDPFRCEMIRSEKQIGDLSATAVSRPGKGSFLEISSSDQLLWSGTKLEKTISLKQYEVPTVVIAYTSGCDYTGAMAEQIAAGIRSVENVETRMIDLYSAETEDVIAAMANAAGILIGTSSADGDAPKPVWDLLTAMKSSIFAGKICGVFGSAAWDTRAVPNVTERLRQLDMDPVDNGFTVQYIPDEVAENSIYEYGYDFGCRVLNVPNTHRSHLVKCLVCGEIFDASLGVCPVCGVGMDKCVPVEDEVITHSEDTDLTYLCVGGGIASLSAAEAIRKRDKTGRIIMISSETSSPVNRPMLTKNMVVAARVENSMAVKEPDWFQENQIVLRLGTSVVSLEPVRKTALLSDGSSVSYDRLIWAAGAECFIPPIKGWQQDGVIAIRHLEDVQRIWDILPSAKNAVVIGGGVLGLEAAAELKKMRLSVTVLELAPKPMGRQLDDYTADAMIGAAADYGIPIHTGVNIVEITENDFRPGVAGGVLLDDGTLFPADLVIMSCGVRANVKQLQDIGCSIGRAAVVSKYMETNIPDTYAAGDCAEFDGVNYQLWAEATEQGRVAGANAAGDRTAYVPVPLGASFEGMNTSMYAIGDVGKNGLDYQIVEYHDEIEKSFRKYWFADGRLAGGIIFGNTEKISMLNDAMEKGRTYYELKDQL